MTVSATPPKTPANHRSCRSEPAVKPFENCIFSGFKARNMLLVAALTLATAAVYAQTPATSSAGQSPQSSSQNAAASSDRADSMVPNRAPDSKDIDAAFNKADANGDGRLDRQEAAQFAPVLQRFDALDADHDGFVTRAELARVAGF